MVAMLVTFPIILVKTKMLSKAEAKSGGSGGGGGGGVSAPSGPSRGGGWGGQVEIFAATWAEVVRSGGHAALFRGLW